MHEQKWVRETLVRSLLRQGKTSAAFAFAEQFQREVQDEFPLLLVRLAQGETAGVMDLFNRQRYLRSDIEQDAELLPLLTDPRFAEVRREIVLDLPSGTPRTSLVLFLRENIPLEEERLRKLLAGGPEFQVKLLPATTRPGRTLAVTHESGILFVTSGGSPYHLLPGDLDLIRWSNYQTNAASPTAFSDLKMHQAWLAIELFDSPAALKGPSEDRLAKSLVQKLCDENLIAMALDEPTAPTILQPANLLRADSLAPQGSWREWLAGGPQLWLSLGTGSELGKSEPLTKKAQGEFAAAIAKLPAGQFAQVKVEWTQGHAAEEAWLKVIRQGRHDYGGYHFTCELQSDSQLHPYWKASERCKVSFWQVRETKLPEMK